MTKYFLSTTVYYATAGVFDVATGSIEPVLFGDIHPEKLGNTTYISNAMPY